jgi:2-succinyl-5-enolpyruvyl-6-hydroxy-3-cyclohexene-1-carboxylate synthase
VVACTSGTAAAQLAPAVIEAHEARVPLLVLTADRPPELREVGAGQTIDQIKLYGSAAKWFFEVGNHEATGERLHWARALACRAYWTALDGEPGAVHLNWPLREPLVPDAPLPADDSGRPGGLPWTSRRPASPRLEEGPLAELAGVIGAHPRGVIVAGRHEADDELATATKALAERAGYPLLADPLSGARAGPAAIAHYDILLRDARFAAGCAPELVLRIGDLPTSKPLRQWLAAATNSRQLAVGAHAGRQDPDSVLTEVMPADPAGTLAAVNQAISPQGDRQWLERWTACDARAARALDSILARRMSEPGVARELGMRLPSEVTLFVASSMPVRDVETFWPARDEPPRVLSNRGANGIDGTVSAAFGAVAAANGPVVLLIGDVALAHDIGGLLAARRLDLALTIVLLNNGGGGIFDFLPVATQTDVYEEHVATPPSLDFAQAAALYGLGYPPPPPDLDAFAGAVDDSLASERANLIEVRSDRAANVQLHRHVWEQVARALE